MTKIKTFFGALFILLVLTSFAGAECFGDFDSDGDVDENDATLFKADFGRSILFNPCTELNPCNGDFNDDGDVDGTDAALFKADLGRTDCLIPPINNTNETNSPIVTLQDPEDNREFKTSEDEKLIVFQYSVSDESNIAYCQLIIDGSTEEKDVSVEKDRTQEFEEELDTGEEYDWKIKCVDIYGNIGFSEEWELEINERDNQNTLQNNQNIMPTSQKETYKTIAYTTSPISLNEPKENTKTYYFDENILLPIILGILILILLILIIIIMVRNRN